MVGRRWVSGWLSPYSQVMPPEALNALEEEAKLMQEKVRAHTRHASHAIQHAGHERACCCIPLV
jgi:hypothetical protein